LNNNYIRQAVTDTIIKCHISTFPIDCFNILNRFDYKVCTYSELQSRNLELYKMCVSYSEDAFRIGNMHIIAYNDKKPPKRIRFSLMHELGHHILGHKNDTPENEEEANYFASNILAPRIAMYYAKLKTVADVSELFEISSSAAYYAAQDFSEWCNEVCQSGMHDYDRSLYAHFYNSVYNGFVYSIKKCEFCGATVYNEKMPYCKGACALHDEPKRTPMFDVLSADDRKVLLRLENNWLYDF